MEIYCKIAVCFIVKNIQELTEKPFNECLVNPDTVGQYTGLKDRNGMFSDEEISEIKMR